MIRMARKYLIILLFLLVAFLLQCANHYSGASSLKVSAVVMEPELKPQNIHYRPALLNPQAYEIDLQAELQIKAVRRRSIPYLLAWSFLPVEYSTQRRIEVEHIKPDTFIPYADKQNGNRYAYWNLTSKTKSERIRVQLRFSVVCYEQVYDIDPDRIGAYDRDRAFYRFYTRQESGLVSFDAIEDRIAEVTGNSSNTYFAFQRLSQWYMENDSTLLQHYHHRLPDSATVTSSANASALMLSFCRAAGIAARFLTGYRFEQKALQPRHWIEFFLPEYGWIPFDPLKPQARTGYWPNQYFITSSGLNLDLPNLKEWEGYGEKREKADGLRFIKVVTKGIEFDSELKTTVK